MADDQSANPAGAPTTFASSAAACDPILALVSQLADEATFGKAKLEKGKLTFDKGDWKLCVIIKGVPKGMLEPWERAGIYLSVELMARIPKLERTLEPALNDKEYAKLPFKSDHAVRPTLMDNLSPPDGGWRWDLAKVGGPDRMAALIVDGMRQWVPVMSSLDQICQRAVHAARELKGTSLVTGTVPKEPALFFGITAGLTAALAFSVLGDATRAKEALAAWLAHPDNQQLLGNPQMSTSRDGVSMTSSGAQAWVDKVSKAIG